jgi:glycerol uptake facilitator protein
MEISLGTVFLSEVLGTGMLTLLGCGVVANVALARTKGAGGGFLLVNFGWGIAVLAGVGYALAPDTATGEMVVTMGIDFASTLTYLGGEMLGAFLGAVVAWLAYKQHFDETEDPAAQLAVFSTGPAIRSSGWNVVTEVIGTFVLVFVILVFGQTPSGLGPLAVALLVVGIGASLGGPTGYAINPARDLGPRIAHAVLPIRGKGSSDWGYSWIPVVGPIIGGVLGGLLANAFI